MIIKMKKLKKTAITPTKGSSGAAAYDLYFAEGPATFIDPFQTAMLGTGIAIEIPEGYFGAIYARSSLATKEGLRPANCVGVIDSDYRGEVIVPLHNDTEFRRWIEGGTRIAQLIVQPYLDLEFMEVEELDSTDRGTGGFGSTGKE